MKNKKISKGANTFSHHCICGSSAIQRCIYVASDLEMLFPCLLNEKRTRRKKNHASKVLFKNTPTDCVIASAVFDTTIRVSIQLVLYRYCGTCAAVDCT